MVSVAEDAVEMLELLGPWKLTRKEKRVPLATRRRVALPVSTMVPMTLVVVATLFVLVNVVFRDSEPSWTRFAGLDDVDCAAPSGECGINLDCCKGTSTFCFVKNITYGACLSECPSGWACESTVPDFSPKPTAAPSITPAPSTPHPTPAPSTLLTRVEHIFNGTNFNELHVKITNEYMDVYGLPGVDYPWAGQSNVPIVEPHRKHTLTILGDRADACAGGLLGGTCEFTWTIAGKGGDLTIVPINDTSIEVVFPYTGPYFLTVQQLVDGVMAIEFKNKTICKYVRREVRKLFPKDRDALLDAMRTLYDVNYTAGILKYGPNYRDMTYFVKKHTELAGDSSCDHLHEGLGFLTNHVAFTLEFELSLQAIEPSISMPYWDYTIDAIHADEAVAWHNETSTIRAWRQSEMFTDDWFGTSKPSSNAFLTVDTGRWAFTPVPRGEPNSGWSNVTNAYGFLRSPWNSNNMPFVARYNKTFIWDVATYPSCTDYIDIMNYGTWVDFGMNIANGPHGPIHSTIGGAWRPDYNFASMIDAIGSHKAETYATLAVASYPQFWRSGEVTCPTFCTLDTPPEDCQCGCPSLGDDNETDHLSIIEKFEVLKSTGVLERIARRDTKEQYIRRVTDETGATVSYEWLDDSDGESSTKWYYEMICTVGMTGDILGSGSPVDPIFWVVHPTIDRLWQWKRLSVSCSYTYDWPDGSSIYVSSGSSTCNGHDEMDFVPFDDMLGAVVGGVRSPSTNLELYNLFDPSKQESPYVYDDFRWDHCMDKSTDVRHFCIGDEETFMDDILNDDNDDDDDDDGPWWCFWC